MTTSRALWPGNYPAGHYLPLLVFLGPLVACLIFTLCMAVRSGNGGRKQRTVDVDPLRNSGISMELAGARLAAALGGCAHAAAAPVEVSTGETVAWLCPTCEQQLPADWQRPSSLQRLVAMGFIGPNAARQMSTLGHVPDIVAIINPVTGQPVEIDPPLRMLDDDTPERIAAYLQRFADEWIAGHPGRLR